MAKTTVKSQQEHEEVNPTEGCFILLLKGMYLKDGIFLRWDSDYFLKFLSENFGWILRNMSAVLTHGNLLKPVHHRGLASAAGQRFLWRSSHRTCRDTIRWQVVVALYVVDRKLPIENSIRKFCYLDSLGKFDQKDNIRPLNTKKDNGISEEHYMFNG